MRAAKRAINSSLGRLQLAIELIYMIFREIDNVYDAIMLGLTHDTLMVIGWEHIRALLVRDSAPWAGSRIICAGSWGDDFPEDVISEKEEEEWYRLYLKMGRWPEDSNNLYRIFNWLLEEEDSLEDTGEDYQRLMRLSEEERRLFRTITKKKRYQWENGWVLVNQTKKEYVTSKAASRILPSMEATDARCFGQLIVSRICWSSCESTALQFTGDVHRGVWAGHRFVIVTMDVFEAMPSAQGWRDVSVEAAKWLREILLAQGEDP